MNKPFYFILVCLFISTQSFAATLTIDSTTNQLLGATGVDVDGSLYDVEFIDGRAYDIYFDGTTWNFTFTTQMDATYAAQALLDQVLLGVYDEDPSLTLGLANTTYGHIYTPYKFVPDTTSSYDGVHMMGATNWSDSYLNSYSATISDYEMVTGPAWTAVTNDYSTKDHSVYALWKGSEPGDGTDIVDPGGSTGSPVPAPGAFLLAGMGASVVGYMRRRRTL